MANNGTMNMRKSKARSSGQSQPQPSDYETDAPASLDVSAPPPRSNHELNLSVLRRHYPSVSTLLSIAPYAVLYLFSPETQQWGKTEVEGTLFVCQLTPSPIGASRFSVIILNRRGLDNFSMELERSEDVEQTEEYVILQIEEDGSPKIYGLWIFAEPPPSSTSNTRVLNAQIIENCAIQAEQSRKALEEKLREGAESAEQEQSDPEGVPMGRQLSLRELFGQQREHDAAFSLHDHHSPGMNSEFAGAKPQVMQNDILGQLFMNAKRGLHEAG